MSIKQVTMFQVVCDGCGYNSSEGGEYWAWSDVDGARAEADAADWERIGDKDYCPECCHFCDGTDEIAPRKMIDCEACNANP